MFASKSIVFLVALIAIQIFIVDADTTVSTVNSTQTWYTCSGKPVKAVTFNVTLLSGIQSHVNDNGTEVPGYNTTAPGAPAGFLVVLATQSEMMKYIDPKGPQFSSINGSCIQTKPPYNPVPICANSAVLNPTLVHCVAVTNPGPDEISFNLDLVWTFSQSSASGPSTTGSASPPTISPTSSTPSPTPTKSGAGSLVANVIYTLVFIGLTTLITLSLNDY